MQVYVLISECYSFSRFAYIIHTFPKLSLSKKKLQCDKNKLTINIHKYLSISMDGDLSVTIIR